MTEQFIKIPVQLLKEERYSNLSLNAVVLYSLLMDRLESSKKNGDKFKDENGEFYTVMTRDEIVDLLRVGKNKVPKIKKELIDHGLLEEKGRGSRTTLYYPQKLKIESGNVGLHALVKAENWSPETGRNDVPKSGITTPVVYQNGAQWSPETGRNDVPKSGTNQTNYNQTDYNQTTVLAPRQSNNVDRDFQTLHNLALGALQKMHFSSNELQVLRNDVREAINGNEQEFNLVKLAIEEARNNNASSWNYVSTVLRNWRAKGIANEDDLYEHKRKRREDQLPEIPDWLGL
ncbi:replication initiator protein A [Streptococcus sp. NLN64]|uniref:replication initiator protein A n=1 Tax=Streptococcus sp. NLN64 TaxID=2822799 RepID=UPI0018C9BEFE|nr:replication initiator protein A [Streptococcus sp. NLN64]MBG9366518.1 replication initiator protein A [Streptococcus sp. NLN64]